MPNNGLTQEPLRVHLNNQETPPFQVILWLLQKTFGGADVNPFCAGGQAVVLHATAEQGARRPSPRQGTLGGHTNESTVFISRTVVESGVIDKLAEVVASTATLRPVKTKHLLTLT